MPRGVSPMAVRGSVTGRPMSSANVANFVRKWELQRRLLDIDRQHEAALARLNAKTERKRKQAHLEVDQVATKVKEALAKSPPARKRVTHKAMKTTRKGMKTKHNANNAR